MRPDPKLETVGLPEISWKTPRSIRESVENLISSLQYFEVWSRHYMDGGSNRNLPESGQFRLALPDFDSFFYT